MVISQPAREGQHHQATKAMPKRVLIIGLLFCLSGISAIWNVLAGLSASRINFNFAVFLLPVGIGLLRGKISSRWWARFWIILGYLLVGALMLLAVASPDSARATWFERQIRGPEAVPAVLGIGILIILLLVAMHKLLYSEKASRYFERKNGRGGRPNTILTAQSDTWSFSQEAPPPPERYSAVKNRTLWTFLVAAIVLNAVGLYWFCSASFRPDWRFWQYGSRGQIPREWTSTSTWQSQDFDREEAIDSRKYLLYVMASSEGKPLAELKLRIQFTIDDRGQPLSITMSDETPAGNRDYAMSSIAEWEQSVNSFQIGLVSAPEQSRRLVTWPREPSKGSTSSIRGAGIGSCPMLMFSLTNIFVRKELDHFSHTAFLDLQEVRALMVAKKDTPLGMFPGGEQPVSWTIELTPDDPDLPVQKFVIAEGEREP